MNRHRLALDLRAFAVYEGLGHPDSKIKVDSWSTESVVLVISYPGKANECNFKKAV